jgi:hypothetical protein
MRAINIKKLAAASAFSLVTMLGTSAIAMAQDHNRDRNDRRYDQDQQRKINQQQEKINRERAKAEQKRLKDEQKRLAEQNRRYPPVGPIQNWPGNYNGSVNNNNRYRIYRNGRYYNTDNRGAELLKQAVKAGYQQGFRAGLNDRSNRRRSNWSNSNLYQTGSYGYQSYVDRGEYQYYFRQGFQRGYQDGYNSRYQYGHNNGGSPSILAAILGQILNIQTY